jgi:hypothetical protein
MRSRRKTLARVVAAFSPAAPHRKKPAERPFIDFDAVNRAALAALPSLVARWLPDGRREGHEWVARNPCRSDRHAGSFSINMNTGRWSDFATGDKGGDPVSLAAYLWGTGQAEAARSLDRLLGGVVIPFTGRNLAGIFPVAPETDRSPEERIALARSIWRRRCALAGSVGEIYLRRARGYGGPLPATMGFLPPTDKYPPAIVSAFGIATEPEPGVLAIADDSVQAVHLIRIMPDGSDKIESKAKIVLGRPTGAPIVLAPPNDLLGLAITEGIEDALSVHEATGLGAWAAGSSTFMPKLVAEVPDYIECVTVVADDDEGGRRGGASLADGLEARGIHAEIRILKRRDRAA